jgi:hypothetical protein
VFATIAVPFTLTRTMAEAENGINQMETPSKRQPLNIFEEKLDKALGNAYAVMLPLSVYSRTNTSVL